MIVDKPPETGFKTSGMIKIFMGGGIGECPNWQEDMIKLLDKHCMSPSKIHLFNPRWEYKWTSLQQIEWEYNKLKESDIIIMWFSRGGQNRIVFYELGMWVNSTNAKAFIGIDPKFDRSEDVVIQTHLARPELTIYTNLEDLARAVGKEVDGQT